jgi:hypothetical protein
MSDYTATDLIGFCLDKDSNSLQDAVNDIMKEKAAEFLQIKKIEVAKNFFNPEDQNA